jgi:hypothetical protein
LVDHILAHAGGEDDFEDGNYYDYDDEFVSDG